MLDLNEVTPLIGRMWLLHQQELEQFNIINDYVDGKLGRPSIPSNADGEVRDIWRLCVLNVLPLVVDAFVQNLSVVGYRSSASGQDAAGWDVWQRNQMDARQAEIYTDAVKYGVGYVVAEPTDKGPVFRPRSPRQLVAVYENPQVDRWPQYALETWVDESDAKRHRRGMLFDEINAYPLDLGPLPSIGQGEQVQNAQLTVTAASVGQPVPHNGTWQGEPVCPVVRYVNRRNSEDLVEGEIYRLLGDQRAINEVNFDRLIVARFGAFPQKVISNWTGVTKDAAVEVSAKRALVFEDPVDVKSFPAASLDPYNDLIDKLIEHVGTKANISLAYLTGKMVNLSADALAAAESNQQRKLVAMRESHGESHEQLLQLGAVMGGKEAPDEAAEVIWRDTEARSFGVMADGLLKVAQAIQQGLPVEPFLPLLPGVTQQMIDAVRAQKQTSAVASLIQGLRPAAAAAQQDQQVAAMANQTTETAADGQPRN